MGPLFLLFFNGADRCHDQGRQKRNGPTTLLADPLLTRLTEEHPPMLSFAESITAPATAPLDRDLVAALAPSVAEQCALQSERRAFHDACDTLAFAAFVGLGLEHTGKAQGVLALLSFYARDEARITPAHAVRIEELSAALSHALSWARVVSRGGAFAAPACESRDRWLRVARDRTAKLAGTPYHGRAECLLQAVNAAVRS